VTISGRNLLHSACIAGAMSCAKILYRWDADNLGPKSLRTMADKLGKIPVLLLPPQKQRSDLDTLWDAALYGQTMRIQFILNSVPVKRSEASWEHVEAEDHHDNTSVQAKNSKFGELWIVSGIDSKSRRLLWSALHFVVYGWIHVAASSGNKCAKRLIPSSAIKIPVAGSNFGSSLAALLSHNAFVDSLDHRCRTVLMFSAAANLSDTITLLLDAGADPNCTDIGGNTPLHYAYAFGATTAAVMLEARGADQSKENFSSCTPIEMAGKIASLLPIYH